MSSYARDALSLIADNTPFRTEELHVAARDLIAQVPDDPAPVVEPEQTGSVGGTVTVPQTGDNPASTDPAE